MAFPRICDSVWFLSRILALSCLRLSFLEKEKVYIPAPFGMRYSIILLALSALALAQQPTTTTGGATVSISNHIADNNMVVQEN